MCKVSKKTVSSFLSYERLNLIHLKSNSKFVNNVLYPMSGCNRNDKVVGTFAHISLFFPDFDSAANLTKIEPHNLTIHMSTHK